MKSKTTEALDACPYPPEFEIPKKPMSSVPPPIRNDDHEKRLISIRLVVTISKVLLVFTASAYLLSLSVAEHIYTGKVAAFSYFNEGLDTYTKLTFVGGESLSFQGNLMFTVGETYSFRYREYGVFWRWTGGPALFVLYSAVPVEQSGG